MMDEEKLNNDLRSRISEVFDNYEDTTADEGWDLLRQKYPPKEKDRGLAWLWYAAAAVVLLCLGVWFIQKPGKPDQLMVKQPKLILPHHSTNNPPANINADTLQHPVIPNNTASVIAQNKVHKAPQGQTNADSLPVATAHPQANATTVAVNKNKALPGNIPSMQAATNPATVIATSPSVTGALAANQNNALPGKTTPGQISGVNSSTGAVYTPTVTAPVIANNKPVLSHKDTIGKQAIIANTGAETKNAIAKNNPVIPERVNTAKTPDSTTKAAGMFAHNQPPPTASKTPAEKAFNSLFEGKNAPAMKEDKTALKDRKKVMLSVYAATYFNYAKGSTNQMNLGAGFTSDFKIANKLRLSTGVFVGQNTLNYNSIPSQSGNLSFASVAPQGSTISFNDFNLSNAIGYKAPAPTKLYNANLIGLDIPVNLKYQFNPQNDTYVAAGLSSGTFINETYQSGYVNSTTVQSTTHSSFSNFDLAKTLNFSFGVGYPLGKSNRLIVEPFLKYPLDGLGSQQLKFGAGGVNLKLNFQSSKK